MLSDSPQEFVCDCVVMLEYMRGLALANRPLNLP